MYQVDKVVQAFCHLPVNANCSVMVFNDHISSY